MLERIHRSGANKLSQKYYSNLNKNLNVQIENPQSEVFFLKMEHNWTPKRYISHWVKFLLPNTIAMPLLTQGKALHTANAKEKEYTLIWKVISPCCTSWSLKCVWIDPVICIIFKYSFSTHNIYWLWICFNEMWKQKYCKCFFFYNDLVSSHLRFLQDFLQETI